MKLIPLILLLAMPAFGQLDLTNDTVTVTAPDVDTIAAWIATNGVTYHHYASNSAGSYVDGVSMV